MDRNAHLIAEDRIKKVDPNHRQPQKLEKSTLNVPFASSKETGIPWTVEGNGSNPKIQILKNHREALINFYWTKNSRDEGISDRIQDLKDSKPFNNRFRGSSSCPRNGIAKIAPQNAHPKQEQINLNLIRLFGSTSINRKALSQSKRSVFHEKTHEICVPDFLVNNMQLSGLGIPKKGAIQAPFRFLFKKEMTEKANSLLGCKFKVQKDIVSNSLELDEIFSILERSELNWEKSQQGEMFKIGTRHNALKTSIKPTRKGLNACSLSLCIVVK